MWGQRNDVNVSPVPRRCPALSQLPVDMGEVTQNQKDTYEEVHSVVQTRYFADTPVGFYTLCALPPCFPLGPPAASLDSPPHPQFLCAAHLYFSLSGLTQHPGPSDLHLRLVGQSLRLTLPRLRPHRFCFPEHGRHATSSHLSVRVPFSPAEDTSGTSLGRKDVENGQHVTAC